jgi:alpha-galactosidase
MSAWPPSGPVMGFSTWYAFRTAINESLVLQQAQALVNSGLAAAGYNCVNLDDGWMAPARDANGELAPDPAKFPNGMAALASEIHALGLKFGIYTAIGTRTCQNLPGSWTHYGRDADTFARWGVDFVKVDQCGGLPTWATQDTVTEDFRIFGNCLYDAIPGVVYSQELPLWALNTPGANFTNAIVSSAANSNMWRVAADEYPLTQANAYPMILNHLAADLHLHGYANPGHWNDLDMVAPGYPAVSGWTLQDLKNQLAVWALEASPLIISADLPALPVDALACLLNPHLIAIDQSGVQCPTSVTVGHVQALVKPDPRGGIAACFVNMGTGTASAQFTLSQLGISSAQATATDIWAGTVTAPFSSVSVTLAVNTTRLLQIQEA